MCFRYADEHSGLSLDVAIQLILSGNVGCVGTVLLAVALVEIPDEKRGRYNLAAELKDVLSEECFHTLFMGQHFFRPSKKAGPKNKVGEPKKGNDHYRSKNAAN